MTEQGSPPPRRGRLPTAGRRDDPPGTGRRYWDEPAHGDEDYPPWAGPGVTPRWADQEARQRRTHARQGVGSHAGHADRDEARSPAAGLQGDDGEPGGWARSPGSRSRKAAARSRRRSRIAWIWGGAAVAVALIVAGVLVLLGGHKAAPVAHTGFVTTFQRGELRTVPNACTAVTSATLNQYLPGKRRVVVPRSFNGSAQSLCTWTLDAPPLYRELEVNVRAYTPSGLATGNGSATNAAADAYLQTLQTLRHPLRATHLPRATLTALHGVGAAALAALQVVQAHPGSTDLETVVARDRNVVVIVVIQGPHARSGKYQAASQSELQSGAIAAATDIVRALR